MIQGSCRNSWLISLLSLCLLLASACAKYEDYKQQRAFNNANKANTKHRITTGTIGIESLISSLAQDSENGIEPSDSSAYSMTLKRASKSDCHKGQSDCSKISSELFRVLREKSFFDAKSFLPLLALRIVDLEMYERVDQKFRIAVMTDALKKSPHFNVWGLPHMYWETGAFAIIQEGPDAVSALVHLLDDKRPAPSMGSEAFSEFLHYKYRVCDYALALLIEILPDKFIPTLYPKRRPAEMPESPEIRDGIIHELLEKLAPP